MIRSLQPADRETCRRIFSACGHGILGDEYPGETEEVVEVDGQVIGYIRWHADRQDPTLGIVQAFCIAPITHGTIRYIRAHSSLEHRGVALGFTRVVCNVPRGHQAYRAYLDKRGYAPYAEQDGRTFYIKALPERGALCAANR